jgi:hypothetical protein
MEISVYRLTPEGLEVFAQDEVIAAWRSGDGAYWVDVVAASDEWRQELLAGVGVSRFVQRAVHDRPDIASVVVTGYAVFFQIPALVSDPDSPVAYIHGFAVPNSLVSLRDVPIEGVDDLVDGLESPTDLPWVGTISELVASLCVRLSTDAYRASQVLRRDIETMSEMTRPDGEFDEEKLSAAGGRLHAIDEVAGDYLQVFESLRDSGSDAIDLTGPHSHIQIAINNAEALTRRVLLIYERLTQMHRAQERLTDERTSRRLGLLSVLSAIFLPLTLLTGIFGMNFEHMPSLSWWWAYPALLAVMAVIGIGMWRYFKGNEWI